MSNYVNAAYILVGHKGEGESGAMLAAHRLTTIEEGNLSDSELLALGETRVDDEIARLRAETPKPGDAQLNVFKTEVRVGFVYIGSAK